MLTLENVLGGSIKRCKQLGRWRHCSHAATLQKVCTAMDNAYLERISGSSVNRHIQLSDWDQVTDSVWKLGIGDQEGRDVAPMQLS